MITDLSFLPGGDGAPAFPFVVILLAASPWFFGPVDREQGWHFGPPAALSPASAASNSYSRSAWTIPLSHAENRSRRKLPRQRCEQLHGALGQRRRALVGRGDETEHAGRCRINELADREFPGPR